MDPVEDAAYKFLMTGNAGGPFTSVTSLLGSFPANDPNPVNANMPWLFTGDLLVNIGNTSAVAVVLSDHGGWQVPQRMGTERFRRLRADIYVDPLRDVEFNVAETSSLTHGRGQVVFNMMNFLFHRRDNDAQIWGDLVTTGGMLIAEPEFIEMPTASGSQMTSQVGTAYWGISFSGWTDVAA